MDDLPAVMFEEEDDEQLKEDIVDKFIKSIKIVYYSFFVDKDD